MCHSCLDDVWQVVLHRPQTVVCGCGTLHSFILYRTRVNLIVGGSLMSNHVMNFDFKNQSYEGVSVSLQF